MGDFTTDQIRRYAKMIKVKGSLRLRESAYDMEETMALAEGIGDHLERPMGVEVNRPFLIIRPEED